MTNKSTARAADVEVIPGRYATLAGLLKPKSIKCLALTALDHGLVVGAYQVVKIENDAAQEQIAKRLAIVQKCMTLFDGYDNSKTREEAKRYEEQIYTELESLEMSFIGAPNKDKDSARKRTLDSLRKLHKTVYLQQPEAGSDAKADNPALRRLATILKTQDVPILFANTFNAGLHSEQEVKLSVINFYQRHPGLITEDTDFVLGVDMPACKRCKDGYNGEHDFNGNKVTFSTLSDTGQHGVSGKSHVDVDKAKAYHCKSAHELDRIFTSFKDCKSTSTPRFRVPKNLRSGSAREKSPGAPSVRKRSKSRASWPCINSFSYKPAKAGNDKKTIIDRIPDSQRSENSSSASARSETFLDGKVGKQHLEHDNRYFSVASVKQAESISNKTNTPLSYRSRSLNSGRKKCPQTSTSNRSYSTRLATNRRCRSLITSRIRE